MLHRIAATATLVGALLLAACHRGERRAEPAGAPSAAAAVAAHPRAPATVRDPERPPEAASTQHGARWKDADDEGDGGGFQQFKEAWVYVDGKPAGVLREVELPPIPTVWKDEVELLDFKAGDPGPHERTYQVRRWRLADYLTAIGVPLARIEAVIVHGGKGVVLIRGDWFRRYQGGILFDLTGQQENKLRVSWPSGLNKLVNTSFDRYAAISVIVDKPVPEVDDGNDLVLDGVALQGIPYYGQPLRGGVRVYLDGRLALVIKRNALGDEGRVAPGTWSVGALLAARHVDVRRVRAIDVIDPMQVVTRLPDGDAAAVTFSTATRAQGAIQLASGQTGSALMLWTEGHVPPVRQVAPATRDVPRGR